MRPSISYQMRNQSRDLFIEKYKAATYERLGDDHEASRVLLAIERQSNSRVTSSSFEAM